MAKIRFSWFAIEPSIIEGRFAIVGAGEYTDGYLKGQNAYPVRSFPDFDTVEECQDWLAEEYPGLDVQVREGRDSVIDAWMIDPERPLEGY
jgi:hypothetical protein